MCYSKEATLKRIAVKLKNIYMVRNGMLRREKKMRDGQVQTDRKKINK